MIDDTGLVRPPNLRHVGIVVKDVEKTVDYYTSRWGLGPWIRKDMSPSKELLMEDGEYCEPFTIRIAGAKREASIIEFIQPLEGKTIWSDFLATKGEGLHHLCFSVTDWEAEVEEQKQQGAKLLIGFKSELLKWAYFETSPGGLIIEIKKGGDL